MYIPGAHQLAQKNHLGSCSFAWNTSTMLPLGRRQTVEPQDRWYTCWAAGMFWKQVVSTSCIKMTWPEKESKEIQSQLTFNWHSIDSCWLVEVKFHTKTILQRTRGPCSTQEIESPPKSSESMWKHQESAASAAIGVQWDWRQFLVSLALKTNEARGNGVELCT